MARLSLCMIVRDEAGGLARAIGSFEGIADEVVVVDTGSVDDTVAVARSLGAKVVIHPWQDSFSAARNAGFDVVTGDWVFALDADERLLAESREEVRRLADTGTAEAYVVTRRDRTTAGYAEVQFVRMARVAERRLVGRIHEHVEPPFTRIERTGVVLEHDGYLPGRHEARLRRNVRLLELELADRPGQAYYLADLAHTYYLLGDPRWAEMLRRAMAAMDLTAARSPMPVVSALLEIGLTAGKLESAESLAERWYPRSVPLLVARARRAFEKGELAAAIELGQRAIGIWESGSYDRSLSFDPAIVGPELFLNLGVALARVGRLANALAYFDRAAGDARFAKAAIENAAAVRGAMGK